MYLLLIASINIFWSFLLHANVKLLHIEQMVLGLCQDLGNSAFRYSWFNFLSIMFTRLFPNNLLTWLKSIVIILSRLLFKDIWLDNIFFCDLWSHRESGIAFRSRVLLLLMYEEHEQEISLVTISQSFEIVFGQFWFWVACGLDVETWSPVDRH